MPYQNIQGTDLVIVSDDRFNKHVLLIGRHAKPYNVKRLNNKETELSHARLLRADSELGRTFQPRIEFTDQSLPVAVYQVWNNALLIPKDLSCLVQADS